MNKQYYKIAPKTWFGIKWKSRGPIIKEGKKYFVALGDSFTYGYQMESYNQTWVARLSESNGVGHVNLAFNGASIEATCRFLDRSLAIDSTVLHVVMLPYPWRSESKLFFVGEKNRRIGHSGISDDQCASKVENTLKHYKDHPVVFSNTWGWTNEVLDKILPLKDTYKNFMPNTAGWLDRALDGEHGHAGPLTHTTFVKQLESFIGTI